MRGTIRQRFVHRDRQRSKFLEVLVMGRPLFRLLPQVFNRIVVRRIRWQRMPRDTIGIGGKKLLGRLAGMLPCPIMDAKQMLLGLGQDRLHERLVRFRGETTLDALIKQAAREIRNSPQNFVALALTTGRDRGLLAASGPGGAQRAPLGKSGLILKEKQTPTPLGGAQNRRPFILQPGLTVGGIEMIRYDTRLVKRQSHVVQQRTHVMAVVEDTKLAPDPHPDEDAIPTGCLTAHHEWTGVNQLHHTFLLPS
jgi:hypothetical protein